MPETVLQQAKPRGGVLSFSCSRLWHSFRVRELFVKEEGRDWGRKRAVRGKRYIQTEFSPEDILIWAIAGVF